MDYEQLGPRIRELRQRLGLRIIDLARKARLSMAQLSRIERGMQKLRSENVLRIARALGTSPAELLLEGNGNPGRELERLGLAPSRTLRGAMAERVFLRFLERCARTARAHKKNLARMEKLLRGVK
jgi:transcriptional regulator with XRE-family HTH domain